MKKRTLAVAALTAAMTLGMSLISFAAEEPTWIVPKTMSAPELNRRYGTTQWWEAEAIEQARAWAEANKGDIPNIQDEKARYEAIVNKVCDFLTYDITYMNPHIAYTVRDGKGVCADYTTLTEALCDVCGIKYATVDGVMSSAWHDMLKVTINGREYYSDPTNYDSGVVGILLDKAPSYFEERSTDLRPLSAALSTGGDTSADSFTVHVMEAAQQDKYVVQDLNGTYYLSAEDFAEAERLAALGDIAGVDRIKAKYTPVK